MILEQSLNDLLDTERYNFFNESQLLYIIDAALSPSNRESKWRVTMEPAAERKWKQPSWMFKDKSSFEYLIPPRGANKRASPVRPRCPIPVSRRNLDKRRARKSARIRFNVGGSSLHERHEEDSSSAVYFLSFLFFSFFFLLLLFCGTRDSVTVLKFSAFSLSPEAVQLGH